MTKSPLRARTKPREEREDDILHAAFDLFAGQGFAATKIEDIAKQASVSKGTVYLYFKTKEEVFEAVVRHYILSAFDRIAADMQASEMSYKERIKFLLRSAYTLFSGPESKIVVMLMGEGGRFPHLIEFYYNNVLLRAQGILTAIITEGIEAGEFRDIPAAKFPQAIIGPGLMGAVWKTHFDRFSPLDLDELYEVHIDILLNGLSSV